ncbi:MAG: hypothetical protein LBF27_14175 [Sphingobacterium sp.]|jgi:hypothetical protein|nr:hypothetical protein [Sphingobacterium sp.]
MRNAFWFFKVVGGKTGQSQSKFPDHYNSLLNKIDQITNANGIDKAVVDIKNTFSGPSLKDHNDYAYLILIIDKLKLKYYSISDDIIKITIAVKQIYEHIIYEKSKFQ